MTTTIAPSTGAGVLFTQQGVGTTPGYSALDMRRSEIVGPVQEGVYAAGDFMVTQRGAGANMSVDIAAGSGAFAAVQGDSVTGQGLYVVGPHSAAAINETIAAADPSNPRIDIVILEIQDNVHDASGGNLARTRVLTGTATAGATLNNRTNAPALPGNALLLADVLVGAAAGSIGNAVIRDRRKWARGVQLVQASLGGGDATTTSATFVDSNKFTSRYELSGAPLHVDFDGFLKIGTAGQVATAAIFMGANECGRVKSTAQATQSVHSGLGVVLAAGSYLLSVQIVATGAATTTLADAGTETIHVRLRENVAQNASNNSVTSG